MGKDGAIAEWYGDYYDVTIPSVEVVNPVGSGDSTLAGFALGVSEGKSIEETLKTGMTFGILNAMEEQTGFINMKYFDEIYGQVQIKTM